MEIREFETPCGMLRLINENGQPIPFTIKKERWPVNISVYDYIAQKRVLIDADNQYTILISTSHLQRNTEYILYIQGENKFTYGDGDERAIANLCKLENVTLSLGAQDLNDAEKDRQAVPNFENDTQIGLRFPDKFDESKFREYVIFPLNNWEGFRFRLFDKNETDIIFRLAWIYHTIEFCETDEYATVTHLTII